jgi:hypothetical protein
MKYVDIVNAELIESTLKQTIMCNCFNDFLWLSKYKKCCVHLIFIDCFIWLMFILKKSVLINYEMHLHDSYLWWRHSRYSVLFMHATVVAYYICIIIFLEDKHKIVLHLSLFYEYQQFFQHHICFSIQRATSTRKFT